MESRAVKDIFLWNKFVMLGYIKKSERTATLNWFKNIFLHNEHRLVPNKNVDYSKWQSIRDADWVFFFGLGAKINTRSWIPRRYIFMKK